MQNNISKGIVVFPYYTDAAIPDSVTLTQDTTTLEGNIVQNKVDILLYTTSFNIQDTQPVTITWSSNGTAIQTDTYLVNNINNYINTYTEVSTTIECTSLKILDISGKTVDTYTVQQKNNIYYTTINLDTADEYFLLWEDNSSRIVDVDILFIDKLSEKIKVTFICNDYQGNTYSNIEIYDTTEGIDCLTNDQGAAVQAVNKGTHTWILRDSLQPQRLLIPSVYTANVIDELLIRLVIDHKDFPNISPQINNYCMLYINVNTDNIPVANVYAEVKILKEQIVNNTLVPVSTMGYPMTFDSKLVIPLVKGTNVQLTLPFWQRVYVFTVPNTETITLEEISSLSNKNPSLVTPVVPSYKDLI